MLRGEIRASNPFIRGGLATISIQYNKPQRQGLGRGWLVLTLEPHALLPFLL